MRRHEPFPVVAHESQQIGALLRREVDFADAKEEDRVEIVQIAREELLSCRDTGPGLEQNGPLGDRLRVGPDDRIVRAVCGSCP